MSQTRVELDHEFRAAEWGLIAIPAVIWGSSFLFMAIGLDHFEPGLITWLRIAFGFAAVALIPAARQPVARSDRPRLAVLGLTWMAFPFTMFPLAQQWIDSSVAGMLNSAMPIFTLLIGWLAFSTPSTTRQVTGILVGVGGIVMIGVPTASANGTSALGVVLVLLAIASYGIAINVAVPLQQRYGSAPVLARSLAFAWVMTTPFGLVGLAGSEYSTDSMLATIAVGTLGSGVAYVVAATLAGRVGAVRTSIVTYLVPIVAVVLGVVFRDEMLTWWAGFGTALVLYGAWLTTRAKSPG